MERWVTWKGKHILVGDDGKIVNNKKTLYHTSNSDFNEFDDKKAMSSTMQGTYGAGHYFFDDKEISDSYGAFNKYQYEVEVDTSNFLKVEQPTADKWSSQKEFHNKLNKMGWDKQEGESNFLKRKGVNGVIIVHKRPDNTTWNEYVVYNGKNINIKNKRGIN